MGLNPVNGGLHRLKHDSAQPTKITLVIPPGDELEVSDEIAVQLHAASTHFVDPADVPESPRQIVKNEHGEAAGWSDGSSITADDAAELGLPAADEVEEAPVEKPKKAPAKKAPAKAAPKTDA